jgi:AmmeMemoRadiSam system protein B
VNKDIRASVIAGSWYPGNPLILKENIEDFFHHVNDPEIDGRIIGLIAPHAGYVYSGQIAAYSYRKIRGEKFDAVVIIGPSHRTYFHGVSVYNRGGYETPLGIVPVDVSLANRIMANSGIISYIPAAHLQEHSVEIQLPFIQVALGEFHFVPLVMGEQDRQTCEALADSIAEAVGDQKVLIVGSSDLSHFHPYDKAVKLDHVALSHIMNMDGRGLLEDLGNDTCEACGGGPMVVTMMISKKLGANGATLLKYANSGDVTGDKKSVVGYASAAFYKHHASKSLKNAS